MSDQLCVKTCHGYSKLGIIKCLYTIPGPGIAPFDAPVYELYDMGDIIIWVLLLYLNDFIFCSLE